MDGWITVQQVAQAMNVTLGKRSAWSIGSTVATEYQRITGSQPPKALRPKTYSWGTHCHAVYPPSWEATIRKAIQSRVAEQSKQSALFGDTE